MITGIYKITLSKFFSALALIQETLIHTFSLKHVSHPFLSYCCVMGMGRLHKVTQPMTIFRSESHPYTDSSTRVLGLCYGSGGFLLSSVVLAAYPFIFQLQQLCSYVIPSSALREISRQLVWVNTLKNST